jgi:hypothetical protein
MAFQSLTRNGHGFKSTLVQFFTLPQVSISPMSISEHCTFRQWKSKYNVGEECMDPSLVDYLLPAMITFLPNSSISTSPPGRPLVHNYLPPVIPPSQWNEDHISDLWKRKPSFFQCLIGPVPPTQDQCDAIVEHLQNEALLACSDGAIQPSSSNWQLGLIFGDNIETFLAKGHGPEIQQPCLCIEQN